MSAIADVAADRALREAAPELLLGYQRRWIADKSPVKAALKGRRVGLTWAEAGDDALIAAASAEAGGMDVFYIGYNLEMAREFVDDCANWARAYHVAAGAMQETIWPDVDADGNAKEIKAFRIDCASGFKIVALPSRPRSLRGMQGKVVIDEAAFHDDLKELLKAAFALLMWGGRVAIISTHDGADNPFAELVEEILAGKKPYSLHRIDFDQALEEGLYRRICLKLKRNWSAEAEAAWRAEIVAFYGEGADEELFCIPSRGSGVFLSGALIEACMAEEAISGPIVRYARPAGWELESEASRISHCDAWLDEAVMPLLARLDPALDGFLGGDFARSADLTVFAPLQLGKTLRRRVPFGVELRNVPYDQQRQILFSLVENMPRFRHAKLDGGGNGGYLAEAARQKFGASRVEAVRLSEEWYRLRTPKFKASFEDRSIELPRDADWKEDLRALRLIKGVARLPDARTAGSDGAKRHGDAAIALLLAHAAADTDVVPIEHHSSGRGRAALAGFEDLPPALRGAGRGADFRGFMP